MFPEPLPTKSSTLMKSEIRIDLVSDTATRPTEAMREAMAKAPVGDESRGEDPSVNALCRRVAELTGKDAAIFLPSGTMCNQIAILVHCRHGDEILTATDSHIVNSEGAGAAALAGAFIRELPSMRGMFDPDALREAVQPKTYARAPRTSLVTVEQTHNAGGGSIWPLAKLQAIRETARGEGLKMHMDGARLLNAVVASGTTARAFADEVDSVWIDFSKGLGCPIGAALAGSHAFIKEAWTWKLRLGGGMRQAGIMAAAGLYALDHHVERLAEDHANAQLLAAALRDIPGIDIDLTPVETNLLFFTLLGATAEQLASGLLAKGIRIGVESPASMRAVTHIDISRADILEAAEAIRDVMANADRLRATA
jgi:threonine aldolase